VKKLLLLLVVFAIMFSGCYSTPHGTVLPVITGSVWNVQVDSDYLENIADFRYAMNKAAQELELQSYDYMPGQAVLKAGAVVEEQPLMQGIDAERVNIMRMIQINDKISKGYWVLISPGKTLTVDMPERKYLHKGKTVVAIVVPVAVGAVIGLIIGTNS